MALKHGLMAATVAALASPAAAIPVILDFEGVGNLNAVGSFYAGSAGRPAGTVFGLAAQALVDSDAGGTGDFANEPSPDTIMVLSASPNAVMNQASGFAGGLSFWYSSTSVAFVAIYSGLDLGGTQLATAVLRPSNDDDCVGDPAGKFCSWNPVEMSFAGIARSVDFRSPAGAAGWDDIAFNALGPPVDPGPIVPPGPGPVLPPDPGPVLPPDPGPVLPPDPGPVLPPDPGPVLPPDPVPVFPPNPGGVISPVPEPGTWALMALGLAGMATLRRKAGRA